VALIAIGAALASAVSYAEQGLYLTTGPDGALTIFEWLNTVVRVSEALPSLFRPNAVFTTQCTIAAAWIAAACIALWAARKRYMRGGEHDPWPSAAWAVAVAITVAVPLGWMLGNVDARSADRSQLTLLGASDGSWLTTPWRNTRPAGSIESVLQALSFGSPSSGDRQLLHVPFPPAGRYRIEVDPGGQSLEQNTFSVEAGRSGIPLLTWPAGDSSSAPFELVMPVHSIRVIADRPIDARVQVRLRVLGAARATATLPGRVAERAARYGDFVVYLLDGAAALETTGFWLTGERRTTLVLAALDGSVPPATLQLEATDAGASAVVTQGRWSVSVPLPPGQHVSVALEQTLDTPAPLEIEVRGGQRGRPAVFVKVVPVV
jgi:hypothetical protein